MTNWIVITAIDLYDAKAAALVQAADSAQLGPGQASRSAQVIADVTAEIRRKVAKCNQLDQNLSAIPNGLKNCALDMIIARLKIALEQELTSAEAAGLVARERELNRIADGKDLVDPPDNPMPANFNQTIAQPSMDCWKHRDFRKSQQDG